VAKKTRQRFVSRVTRLYEQGSIHQAMIEGYERRWKQWATGGLGEYAMQLTLDDDVVRASMGWALWSHFKRD